MNQFEDRKSAVKKYLESYPNASDKHLSRVLGIPQTSVWRARQELRGGSVLETSIPKIGHRRNEDESIELVTSNPCTLDDLLKACRVDLKTWRVSKHVVNKWETASKHPDTGKITRTPLFQIKAFLERVPGFEDSVLIRETIEWIKKQNTSPRSVAVVRPRVAVADPVMLELTIPDLHYGRLSWNEETGKDYDTSIAASLYIEATKNLWTKCSVFPVEKILLVVGNDFFNSDGKDNATTAGTPQQEGDTRWPKTFRRGVALIRHQIEYLRGKAPGGVDVVFIAGNHDQERCFVAGEVIAAVYESCKDVCVTNKPIKRQYYQWGTVGLGLTHGDKINLDKLPLIFAGEAPEIWAATTHREIHTGHRHHSKETRYHTGIENGPVRVRVLPSLTVADEYHFDNGYVGAKQAAEAYLWGKKAGYVGHLSWTVPKVS